MIVAIGTFFIGISPTVAQEQERKLIDRVLKPDTSLQNSAQNKKFTGVTGTSFDKSVRTQRFYSPAKTVPKTFQNERVFTPRQFAARHFRAGDSAANISTRSRLTRTDTVIATTTATAGTRVAPESGAAAPVHEFAGNRPFLEQGKSQKSLQTQNKPLTIEQVRELLNKSK